MLIIQWQLYYFKRFLKGMAFKFKSISALNYYIKSLCIYSSVHYRSEIPLYILFPQFTNFYNDSPLLFFFNSPFIFFSPTLDSYDKLSLDRRLCLSPAQSFIKCSAFSLSTPHLSPNLSSWPSIFIFILWVVFEELRWWNCGLGIADYWIC